MKAPFRVLYSNDTTHILTCRSPYNPYRNWQGGGMVLRWAAGAFLTTEANFRRTDGYRDLWMLKAALDEEVPEGKGEGRLTVKQRAARTFN